MMQAFRDELVKVGAISDDQARASLERYDTLERSKFTPGQVGRYAGLGAAGGVGIGMAKDLIQKGRVFDGQKSIGGIARHAAGSAVAGALASGGLPLVRNQMDRGAERATLQKYLKQQQQPKTAATLIELLAAQAAGSTLAGGVAGAVKGGPGRRLEGAARGAAGAAAGTVAGAAGGVFAGGAHDGTPTGVPVGTGALGGLAGYKALTSGLGKKAAASGITPAKRWSANEYADMGKMGTFETSQYTSKLPKEETVPESKLAAALVQIMPKIALATTPAGRLAQSKGVGLPKMSPPPGPSISQVSRTFGPPMPGAVKGGIGKGMGGGL